MTYTQAQIDRANAANLEDFLRAQGETLVRSGKEYRWKAHDSLTVCGNKWFRHSQSKGGHPVDFVMEFYGKSFPEAVQMLTGEPGEVQPEADPAPSPAFRLPLRNVTNANILSYLTQERKLSPSLVNFFIAAGDIYEDSSHHNVVFVGRDADGHPRYASSRGIQEKFRQDVAGAEKAFGFAHRGTDKQLLVFEAPIDLLSFIELFPKNWQQHNYLSLGGVSGKALQQFLSERPDMERVFLCLDADKAGEDACKRLAGLLPDSVSVTRIQPCMKDWNDVLVHRAEIPNRNYFKSIALKEPSKPETVKIIRMSDVELTPVEWLWKPYLPFGKLSVLQGNPGEGKTYFAMHLAAACTNGKLLPNMERMEPFNVIYQTAEDGLGDTVKPRLMEAEADLERVLVIDDRDTPLTLSLIHISFETYWPGLGGIDLLVGLAGAAGVYLLIQSKIRQAKKFRRDAEYGTARFGTKEDIKPFVDPKFQNNVILTGTELSLIHIFFILLALLSHTAAEYRRLLRRPLRHFYISSGLFPCQIPAHSIDNHLCGKPEFPLCLL